MCFQSRFRVHGIYRCLKTPIRRLTLNICQESGHCKGQYNGDYSDHRSLFHEIFKDLSANSSAGSAVVKLRQGVQLSCDRIYLLVLTCYGGVSYVGTGGEEFVTVRSSGEEEVLFKFEDYKHRTDKHNQSTNVQQGLVENIYFSL